MMQRKPGFPVANCSIKMPDNLPATEPSSEDDGEQQQRRLQLVNFGHSQWGFNNWSWAVTKQDLDFIDQINGKYCAGVVAFVSISVKNLDIHRENIGYATSVANNKGFAIYKSRKVAVTNALRETLLSFGGSVATELMEQLETSKDIHNEPLPENNQNIANTNIANNNGLANAMVPNLGAASVANTNHAPALPNNHVKPLEGPPLIKNLKKETDAPANIPLAPAPVKNAAPIAKAHPMPANVPARLPAPRPLPPAPAPQPVHPQNLHPQNLHPQNLHPRPNSNEGVKLENMTDEEARAERKRRQRLAQEEFRLKQLEKQSHIDDKPERNTSSLDQLLMEIPTRDNVIEETGTLKRKSPSPDISAKRRAEVSKLATEQAKYTTE